MKYNFITRANVEVDSGSHKRWLTVGIICLLIAMILELMLNQKFAAVFVVPILYLIGLRAHAGGKASVRDVELEMNFEADKLTLLYKNTVLSKKSVYSRLYTCPYNRITRFTYGDTDNIVYLIADMNMEIIDNAGHIIKSKKCKNQNVELFIPEYCIENVLNSFRKYVISDNF